MRIGSTSHQQILGRPPARCLARHNSLSFPHIYARRGVASSHAAASACAAHRRSATNASHPLRTKLNGPGARALASAQARTRAQPRSTRCRIVVFGNDSCPFCTELERTLNDRAAAGAGKGGAGWSYYRLNRLDNGKALRAKLTEGTGQRSVPYLFVDGQLLGGTDDLKGAEYAGTQPGLLRGGGVAADVDAPTSCDPCVCVSTAAHLLFTAVAYPVRCPVQL